jgi:hypothetical protein
MDCIKEYTMERTWKPIVAGVLSIVAGALALAFALLFLLIGGVVSGALASAGLPNFAFLMPLPIVGGVSIPFVILGSLAIAGGSYAIRRKLWPLALTGAICALFPPQIGILGILAIVFVVLGRQEFS